MIYNLKPLDEAVKQWEKQDIVETLAAIKARPKWDKNEATYVLQAALKREWERRGFGIVPQVLADSEMVLTSSNDASRAKV